MDVGMITNNNVAEQANVSKESRQSEVVKKYGVTGKTIGKPKLSEKAQEYYEQLQAKYQDMDFVLVSKDKMDVAKSKAGSFASSKKMLVLVDEETIERMAKDEEYRKQYEGMIEYAQKKMPELQDLLKNIPGAIGGGVQINENGTVSFFAIMDKSYDEQKERLEKQKQEKVEEKKEAEKKAEKEKQKKWFEDLREKRLEKEETVHSDNKRNPFSVNKKENVEIVTASSMEELVRKVEEFQFSQKADRLKSETEKYLGTVIDFKG